jgi:tRNA G37 N-methylase Trm5
VIPKIEMGRYRKVLFSFDEGSMVVDPFAEVCYFSYVLFMADITADKIDAAG